ncbi:hypothetical protein ABEX25_18390 [Paenibacillus thiaminolyticus]|uniref:hypothetical protein n=1 Tax=Paenibacillus thiaminolyticus TaxID=49283 RepID=UPI003D2DA23C
MTMRWIRSVSLLLLACILLSGCDWLEDPKSLMSMPRLPEDKAKIMTIISSQMPKEAEMLRPANAEDASAIRLADLNNDGRADTAIVFYETPDKDVRLHGLVFHSDGETWNKVVEFDGVGVSLDRVELVDLTHDNKLDLVVGYGGSDKDLNKGLVVYSFTQDGIVKIFEQPYSQFVIDDLNGDGKNQLYIVNNRRDMPPVLAMYDFKDGKMAKQNELTLDKDVNMYTNMISGYISKNQKGIVLDAVAGANYGVTDIIKLTEDNQLVSILPEEMAIKPYNIASGDMNGDGIIEIAIPEMPSGWDIYESYVIPYFTSYYQWDEKNGLKLVEKQYRDYEERFQLKLPNSWYGRVTIDTKSKKDEYIRFMDMHTNETLAEIKFFNPEMWETYKEKWTYLSSYGDTIIGVFSKEPLRLNRGTPKIPDMDRESNE